MRSLKKPDFYPIPKLTPVLQSYDIPAPVIIYSRPDPFSLLNPDQSPLPCNDILEPVMHHSRSDPIQVLDNNKHGDQGLDPESAMDIDPWIASWSEIEVDERIAHLTPAEHAGGTLGEPITIVPTTSSGSSASSIVGAPELVSNVVETKGESKKAHSSRCDVCRVICNSQKSLKRHLEGKIHLKNTRKLPVTSPINQEMPLPAASKILDQDIDNKDDVLLQNGIPVDSLFYCSIPEPSCANQDSRNIVSDQVREPMYFDEYKPSKGGTHNAHEKLSVHQPMWHDVCKVNSSSAACFERHISEKIVAPILPSTAIKPEVVNPFECNSTRCELCGITCTSHHELNNHISGKKHKKKLNKSGNLNGNSPATAAKQSSPNPMIKEGEIVEESNKRKGNISLSSDGDNNKVMKKQKTMEEDAGSGVLLTCQVCNAVCKGIMAFNSHLASSEHSAMVMKQVGCG